MRIHPVFQVFLLEAATDDLIRGQHIEPPPPIQVDGEEAWEVEEILDSRLHYRRGQYKVKWLVYKEPSWQPASKLDNVPDKINDFHYRYPRKPGPWDLTGARS